MAILVIQADGEAPRTRELTAGTLTLGRKSDNHIRLDDSTVSGHHAKIVTYFSASHVEDLGSTNGTFVNGRRIRMHTLRPGDVVTIGRHTLTVQETADEPAPVPQAPVAEHTTVFSSADLDRALAELQSADAAAAAPAVALEVPSHPAPQMSEPAAAAGGPHLRVMAGPNTGERIYLGEAGAALDRGVGVRRTDGGFVLDCTGSHGAPVRLNSREIGTGPVPLKDMDMLQVGSIWLAFFAE